MKAPEMIKTKLKRPTLGYVQALEVQRDRWITLSMAETYSPNIEELIQRKIREIEAEMKDAFEIEPELIRRGFFHLIGGLE